MLTDNPSDLSLRIRRMSRLLDITCLLLIVALPPIVAIYWGIADAKVLAVRANLSPDAMHASPLWWQRLAAGFMAEIPLCLLLTGVWHARKCFRLFVSGRVFTPEVTRCLQRFSSWAMASRCGSVPTSALPLTLLAAPRP